MTTPQDLVTVVIPTRNRPDLVLRAVGSALDQTHTAVEVIVVIDGPDPATVDRLSTLSDPRLTVLALESNIGAAKARNLAVQRGTGRWVAFLDDDDHWLPEKLEQQLAAVPKGALYPIVSTRCRVVTARGEFVWPRRLAKPGDGIAEYLFVRRGLFKGETFAPTSTLLVPRELLLRVPFPKSAFDDWEWLIAVGGVPGTVLVTAPGVLTVHYAETNQVTLSTCHDIDRALDWAEYVRPMLTPKAFAGLLLQTLGGEAAARNAEARRRILRIVLRDGRPSAMALATFLAHSLMPVTLRRRVRQAVFGTRPAAPGRPSTTADAA